MYSDLQAQFGLKSLDITDVRVQTPGQWPEKVTLADARCPGQCAGGGFPIRDALEEELTRMSAEHETEGTLHISCPRTKPSSSNQRQTCLGSLSARVVIQYPTQ